MRKFFYRITEHSHADGTRTTHLYIWAKPKFSLREMLAKQDKLFWLIVDVLPEAGKLVTAAMREAEKVHYTIRPKRRVVHHDGPQVCALSHVDYEYSRVKKEVSIYYDNVLEIVFFERDREMIKRVLDLLKKEWGGVWEYMEKE